MNKLMLDVTFIQDYMKTNKIKSISYLAEEIGISRSMLSKLLRGDRHPGSKVVGKMMAYFKVPFDSLFSFDSQD